MVKVVAAAKLYKATVSNKKSYGHTPHIYNS